MSKLQPYKAKDGKLLYGYSLFNLEKLTKIGYLLAALLGVVIIILLYLLWWGHRYHVFTKLIHAMGG